MVYEDGGQLRHDDWSGFGGLHTLRIDATAGTVHGALNVATHRGTPGNDPSGPSVDCRTAVR